MLTVITCADSYRLTTLAATKAELSLSSGDDDAFLTGMIDQASAIVRRWCGCAFALETVRETFRLSVPAGTLSLSRWPVVSVISVTEGGKMLTPTAYEMDSDAGFVYRLTGSDQRRPWPVGKIMVEYTAGYVLPGKPGRTLPEDVERATIMLVKIGWFARLRDPLVRSESVDGVGSTTYWVGGFGNGASLPADVEGLLSPYRQSLIG